VEGVLVQNLWDATHPNRTRNVTRTTGQNIAIGSMRIRLLKVRDASCDINEFFYPDDRSKVPRVCYGRYTDDNAETATFGDNNISFVHTKGCKHSGMAVVGEIERYPCGGYIRDIPFSASYNEALAWVNELRAGSFVNENSARFLGIEFVTYNPALDIFTSNRVIIEVTYGGAWLPTTRFRNFGVFVPTRGRLAYEFYFLLFIFYYWIKFFTEWRRSRRGLAFIFSLWPFFEVVNLSSFLVVFIARWVWWQVSAEENWTLPGRPGYPESLDYIQNMYQIQVYFNSLNCVITFLKLLKFVRLNDRLNILTRTLEACSQNILGVLILFVLVIFAYSITGCTLFGGGLADYRNISTAFSTCMRTVIGQFDYKSMKDENRSVAFIYFWTFVVLANFVLLNFIIAVISEGFQEESKRTKAVPFDFYVARWGANIKSFFSSLPQMMSSIYSSFVARTKRLPEVTILDYMVQWRQSQLTELNVTEEMIEHGIVAEPELEFSRHDFKKIMPRTALQDITDVLLDEIWEDTVIEFELQNKLENEEKKNKDIQLHRKVVIQALTDTLLHRASSSEAEGKVDFFGGTTGGHGSEVINKLFSNPRKGLQGLNDRTEKLQDQIEAVRKLMSVAVNKASSLQYVGVKQ
jgi:hypothetical protein